MCFSTLILLLVSKCTKCIFTTCLIANIQLSFLFLMYVAYNKSTKRYYNEN